MDFNSMYSGQSFEFPRPTARSAEGLLQLACVCVCILSHILSPVIGQTVQKLVPHWIRPGAMFRSRIKFWGVGGEMLITVQFYTNRFCQLKQVWYAIMHELKM